MAKRSLSAGWVSCAVWSTAAVTALIIVALHAGMATALGAQFVSVDIGAKRLGPYLSRGFVGLSYEKSRLNRPLFRSSNTALVRLFRGLGPGLLRLGGNSVDQTNWNAAGDGLRRAEIAPADLERLAGFVKAAHWQVIYGLNLVRNTKERLSDEASHARRILGDRLYGLEIGNEPDLYAIFEHRRPAYDYAHYREEWRAYARALRSRVPAAVLAGPATSTPFGNLANVKDFTLPFAEEEKEALGLLTQHYYRGDGRSSIATIDHLLATDTVLPELLKLLVPSARNAGIAGGVRLAEANSYYNDGAPGVSNTHAAALWAIDFLFASLSHGAAGVDFHGGGLWPGYTPIADDGEDVVEVRPEFYGIFLFALAGTGDLVETKMEPHTPTLSAWAIEDRGGRGVAVMLLNKDKLETLSIKIRLRRPSSHALLTWLSAADLSSTAGQTINGAAFGRDGAIAPRSDVRKLRDRELLIQLPAGSAVLCKFAVQRRPPTQSNHGSVRP